MRQWNQGDATTDGTVSYIRTDHLGSTTGTTNSAGVTTSGPIRYKPWGEYRSAAGNNTAPTTWRYTGQREDSLDLYYYNARWYDPYISQFSQPDTVVQDQYNPLDWNRYAYVRGNPINHNDPTGKDVDCGIGEKCEHKPAKLIIPNKEESKKDRDTSTGPKIDVPCSPNHPCLYDWEQPFWWDTNPQKPDYFTLAISAGETVGGTFTITMDRYGNVYVGVGGNIGKSISPVTGTLNSGFIGSAIDNVIPDQGNISDFLTGLSVNGGAGLVGDVAVNWSPFAGNYVDHVSGEFGGALPFYIGASATWGIKVFDGNTLFGQKK